MTSVTNCTVYVVGAARNARPPRGDFANYNNPKEASHVDLVRLMRSLPASIECYDPMYPSSGTFEGIQYFSAEMPDIELIARENGERIVLNYSGCLEPSHVPGSDMIWIHLVNEKPSHFKDNSVNEVPLDLIRVFGGNIGFTSFREVREYCNTLRDAGIHGPFLVEPIRQMMPILRHMYWPDNAQIRQMLSVYLATEADGDLQDMFDIMSKALQRGRDEWLARYLVDCRKRLIAHIVSS